MNLVEDARWVLAIDPGLVTGWALYNLDDHPKQDVSAGETDGRHALADKVRSIISTGVTLEVVCEDFVISERTIKTARDDNALRIIGWLDLELEHLGIELTLQTPAQAKAFATDDKLKTIGWYDSTPGGHRNDALRHLLVYMVRHHPDHASEILKDYR